MTGGAGAVFQVNGFRGGRLPTRDEIRQIRFRMNSFSADNHDAGRVQVEIITRPGLTRWSGNANLGLRNDVLNARNAFARDADAGAVPPLQRRPARPARQRPDVAPLQRRRQPLVRFGHDRRAAAGRPHRRPGEASVRADQRHRRRSSTGSRRTRRCGSSTGASEDARHNLGVGDFNLPERAFDRSANEHQVRASVQSLLGRTALNEFRVAVQPPGQRVDVGVATRRRSSSSTPSAAAAPASRATDRRGRSRSPTTSTSRVGKHAMRVGLLLEAARSCNCDARNAAGTFTFSSLEAFLAGTPNTFTQRLGELQHVVFPVPARPLLAGRLSA